MGEASPEEHRHGHQDENVTSPGDRHPGDPIETAATDDPDESVAAPDLDEDVAGRLSSIVQMEAHRMVSQAGIEPDPQRIADGWERRFIADGARAEEAVALYQELGYEVVADDVSPDDLPEGCEACRLVAMLKFKSIYTRRPS
jgi:hypothetical protein